MQFNCFVEYCGIYMRNFNVLTVYHKIAKRLIKTNFAKHIEHHTGAGILCWNKYMHFGELYDDSKEVMIRDMKVIENFLSEDEEKSLHQEVEPFMKRLRYEFDHWDDAIHGYRETERLEWNPDNTRILQRVRDLAFPPGTPQLSLVHVLDLAEKGVIKPHIDSVRFCGNTIAGLSLLSDSVMRLVHDKNKDRIVDILLKRRSLYVMKDMARYEFTHEILGAANSKFGDLIVPRERRISVICRNEPGDKIAN